MNNKQARSSAPHDKAIADARRHLVAGTWSESSFDHFDSALEQIYESSRVTAFSTQAQSDALVGFIRHAYVRLLSGDPKDARCTLERALAFSSCGSPSTGVSYPSQMTERRSSDNDPTEESELGSRSSTNSHSGNALIKTLGTFQMLVNGRDITLKRKPPYRLLTLLKVLIANGGCAVTQSAISDALWPDLDGDHAHDAQQIALHRLRALLGSKESLLVTQGSISLNAQIVRVDAFFLDSLCRDVFSGGHQQRARVALELYRGPFLPEEIDSSWAARMRDCQRAKFVNIVATAAAELEAKKDYIGAASLYEEAIAIDDLEDLLHQGLIRSLRQVGSRTRTTPAKTRIQKQSSH